MQVRSIILGALGAIVAIFFLKLVFDSQGSESAVVGEAELEKALAEYRRTQKLGSDRAVAPIARSTVRKSKASAKALGEDDSRPTPARAFTKPPPLETDEPEGEVDQKSRMDAANKEYDRANYEGAREAALELLSEDPKNVRMNRIVVSSSCIMGDEEVATKYFATLPPRDQRQMSRRCKRYGIDFEDIDP